MYFSFGNMITQCGICEKWFLRGNSMCAVMHPLGTCCHYGDTEVEWREKSQSQEVENTPATGWYNNVSPPSTDDIKKTFYSSLATVQPASIT